MKKLAGVAGLLLLALNISHSTAPWILTPEDVSPTLTKLNNSSSKGCSVFLPTWELTDGKRFGSFHRFFDSSPFSPTGRYIAFTRVSREDVIVRAGMMAEVVVMDLVYGAERAVASTTAWESQLGAQVQWGWSDDVLVYNDVVVDGKSGVPRIAGVRHNITSGEVFHCNCAVYHVSEDGLHAVSPTLNKLHLTQLGYGAYLPKQHTGLGRPHETDGVYLTDLKTGECRLLASILEISSYLGFRKSTPLFGFHVKFSSDKKRVLVIVRSMTKKSFSDPNHEGPQHRKLYNRVAHMVVIDGMTGSMVRYLLSYSGRGREQLMSIGGVNLNVHGGNHPTWLPGSSNEISMNLQRRCSFIEHVWNRKRCFRFDVVIISFRDLPDGSNEAAYSNKNVRIRALVDGQGSGHPVFTWGGRYLLVDAYAKEAGEFKTSEVCNNRDRISAPLRLIDTITKKSVTLLELSLLWRNNEKKFIISSDPWRCDMHPAFSRDGRWIALNGRPAGHMRQVIIAYIGSDLQSYFFDV